MIILDTTTRTVEVLLGGAVTTNQLPVVVSYVDVTTTTYTPGSSNTATNNTTAVTVVAAPAASTERQVKLMTVYNADTVNATLTVRYNDNGTPRIITKTILSPGDSLMYTDGEGFRVIDTNGNYKTAVTSNGVTSVSVVSANGLAGSVANATTTPAITLSTSVTGILQGNGTAISAATAGTDYAIPSGNVATATALQTGRTINGVTFDGTSNIVVTADAGTLTGTTLNSSVVTSSLTSVGTIGTGTWQGTAISPSYVSTGTSGANIPLMNGANTWSGKQTYSGGVYQSSGAAEEAVYSNGNSGTSLAVNLDNGNMQSVTITGAVAISQTTPTYPGKYTLIVTQDGTGHVYSLSGIKWPGGTAPTYSTAANKVDVISVIYDGTNYYGMAGIAFL